MVSCYMLLEYTVGDVSVILQVMVYSFLSLTLWLYSHKCSNTGANFPNMTPCVCVREREEREKASETGRERERLLDAKFI